MKTLLCSAIHSEKKYVFAIELDDTILFHLKEGVAKSIALNDVGFKYGVILTIPYEDESISVYTLKRLLNRGSEPFSKDGFEYLLLDETERYAFAKEHNRPFDYAITENKVYLSNLRKVSSGGKILIENGSINFTVDLYPDIISESIPYDFIEKNILNSKNNGL